MWQTLALGAYSLAGAGAGHWTSASNVVELTDTRVTPNNNDAGTIWIVWNKAATEVWSFTKVDSVVGVRCYFAQPQCYVNATSTNLAGTGANQISSTLWGDGSSDTALPANVAALFDTGTPQAGIKVTVAATDIRPEDAAFAVCRVNSELGAGSAGGSASDGLDGLGYNSNNAPGVCPAAGLSQANYVGTPIKSGFPPPSASDAANVLSFNITGNDPISGTVIPAHTVERVGAAPIVFVDQRETQLNGATNATDVQLQQIFSGADCNGSEIGGAGGAIEVFLREPLSGTYNATEATVFRKPTVYPSKILGVSQETGVDAPTNNPLANLACAGGGGARTRAIGTGEEVKSVLDSQKNYSRDGIGYAFFSYGNVSSIANSASYGYVQLESVDPIFASFTGGDPGQPATSGNPSPGSAGTLPAAANLPSSCASAFPCPETDIWTGGLSFPNLRSGDYWAWSLLRLVSNGTPLGAANALIKHSQGFVVTSVPDYVPAAKTTSGGITDPGLTVQRSHYQQYDGAGTFLGLAPLNGPSAKEEGGDMGGFILKTTGKGSTTTQEVDADIPNSATRPKTP
jgi:hypothetical protein